ncbi:MAG: hypothetical protein IJM32_01545 [Ruminococcus sp.]|nr:hypothetical protein [Ruminococcus sp.]
MLERYNEIMNISRPQYADLPQMSASDRAAQFSPFAALVGYDEAVDETARLTQDRIELTEDEQNALNANLNRVLELLDDYLPTVTVTYFVPDERKSGGRYVNKTGEVRIYDSAENALVFTDGVHIAVNDMLSVVTQ